jgi:hypothetical protein
MTHPIDPGRHFVAPEVPPRHLSRPAFAMVATLFSSAVLTMDHRTAPLQGALCCLAALGWVATKAYETSTFDATAFAAGFPVSYVAAIGKAKKGAALPAGGPADITLFAPVVLVTAAWALLYYAFLWDQSATAFVVLKDAKKKAKAEGKPPPSLADVKYGRYSKSARVRAADRTVGNFLEQSPAFLVSLWLHSAFVSPVNASAFGWTWLGFRAVYPWAYRLRFPGVFISTMPAYGCVFYLLGEVVRCALKM